MNRSNLPGFTAHASLYRTGVSYAAEAWRGTTKSGNDVIAQKSMQTERWYARCKGGCLGGYIGSLGTTDLSGCWDNCDFLYDVIEN